VPPASAAPVTLRPLPEAELRSLYVRAAPSDTYRLRNRVRNPKRAPAARAVVGARGSGTDLALWERPNRLSETPQPRSAHRGRAASGPGSLSFAACLVCALCSGRLQAAEPTSAAPRRLTLGVEAVASASTADPGYYDDTDYNESVLRLLRVRLDASLRLGPRAALLAEGRADNGDGLSVAALYLRVRPFPERALDVQAGRIPPVFGAFSRRSYGAANALIGSPLAYQYLTSLRADALPASADDLLAMRGRGWLTHYPVGSAEWAHGLPLVAGDRWDTGAEIRVGTSPVAFTASLSQGTLADPRVRDDNGGKQIAARAEVRPAIGWVLGASVSHGEYVTREAAAAIPAALRRTFAQRALGADAEWSRGYWVLRGEAMLTRWSLPALERPLLAQPLGAWGGFVEARYKIRPGLFAAARADHLGFSRVTGTLYGGRATPWDAPVSRIEAGAGYSVRRNLTLKGVLQRNWRRGVPFGPETVAAFQALVWF
jgi:hypothetical protein